ncbi:L-threonine 3-dehydrogenase [Candidatus Woesearchaeota archaeon]|nr:L-threonine 3-dehydrogenase [Candidatus Woesearchaeota archaeon]
MKAIIKKGPFPGAELIDTQIPQIGPEDVLVKIKVTSICGTDLHIYDWNEWAQNRIKPPIVFGHEFCGEIIETGKKVNNLVKGDFVSAETHIICGKCYQCKHGQGEICSNVRIIGVDIPGCFAEYIAVPASCLWKNDKKLNPEYASVQEPFGNSVHALFADDKAIEGKTIAIFGCGPTGLFATAIAKASGAKEIIVSDVNSYRMKIAKKSGADYSFNPKEVDVVAKVKDLTGGVGVDIVLEMSGNAQAFQSAVKSCRRGGRVTMFGLFNRRIDVDFNDDLIFSGRKLVGITGRKIWSTWEKTAELLKSKKLNINPIITHRFKLEEFEKGMALMQKGECGKVILKP